MRVFLLTLTYIHPRNRNQMPEITLEKHKDGDVFVDYEEKVFEDVQAEPGQKALVKFHTVAFEGSIGLVNMLNAIRLNRKGFETSILLYGPGVTLGLQRGFPSLMTNSHLSASLDCLTLNLLHSYFQMI